MPSRLKQAYRHEFIAAKEAFAAGDLDRSFRYFERAHILGQRFFWAHLITHVWMLRIALARMDSREIIGQVVRMIATVPGYLFGWIPVGNTGGANVSALKPMPVPSDLSEHFVGYSVWRGVRLRLFIICGLALAALAWWHVGLQRRIALLDVEWSKRQVTRLAPFGSTASLRVLPLVNWHAARGDLQTEAGVSLLVRTDQNTVLFDVGWNSAGQRVSPLQQNMKALGVTDAEIDTIFISHRHHDHVGGRRWERAESFSLGGEQEPLRASKAFAPVAMHYPGLSVDTLDRPRAVRPAIASTGPIDRELALGRVSEQAMVVHLAGRGLVVFVGCGHQTVTRLLAVVQEAFAEPVYALIGDLHYPVPAGRRSFAGLDLQRLFASGRGPFQQIDMADVQRDLEAIKRGVTGLVAMGGHDTSDEVLALFASVLGSRFRRIEVGSEILLP